MGKEGRGRPGAQNVVPFTRWSDAHRKSSHLLPTIRPGGHFTESAGQYIPFGSERQKAGGGPVADTGSLAPANSMDQLVLYSHVSNTDLYCSSVSCSQDFHWIYSLYDSGYILESYASCHTHCKLQLCIDKVLVC